MPPDSVLPLTPDYLHGLPTYTTLSEAVNDLQCRGYTDDLQLSEHGLICGARGPSLNPAEFEIDEFHRFEGNSDPEDQCIVYAISSIHNDVKGILVNAYGMDASAMTQELVRKLATHRSGPLSQ